MATVHDFSVLVLDCGCEVDEDCEDYCGDCACCEDHCTCSDNYSWEDELYAQAEEYDSPHTILYHN